MTGRDAILTVLASTKSMPGMYLGELSDADLLVRPVSGANHIAWQMGHLITSEARLIQEQLPDAQYPALPAGFAEAHAAGRASADGPDGFLTKAEYLALYEATRNATIAAVSGLTDSDLDRSTIGRMAPFAPTLAGLITLVSNHVLMHAGQFTVVRRKLGKTVMF